MASRDASAAEQFPVQGSSSNGSPTEERQSEVRRPGRTRGAIVVPESEILSRSEKKRGSTSTAQGRSNSINSPARENLIKLSTRMKKKQRRPMLTSSQLSDLFTRLDKNGDGELDLDEFTGIIKMLKINVTPDYIARVFRTVDQAYGNTGGEGAGTLDMQEFIAAYQKIYCGATVEEMASAASKRESFVRATRYGCLADGSYVFECYTIPTDGVPEKHTFADIPTERTSFTSTKNDKENLRKLSTIQIEPWLVEGKHGTMDHLDILMRQDSARNKSTKSCVLWWVDVAYSVVDRTTGETLVDKFGLPNDSKFIASFGNFGNGLPADPKSRMFAGNGIDANGSVYSLSFFAQALFVKNVPVVHHLPPWLWSAQCSAQCMGKYASKIAKSCVNYYTSRFAWMYNLSWLSSIDEKISAYERAEGLAMMLKTCEQGFDDEEEESDSEVEDKYVSRKESSTVDRSTIFSSNGAGIPLRRRAGFNYPPTWLRSNSQINKSPPQVNIDSMSLHILDYGYGAHALLTVRQVDGERQKKLTLEQQSRAGVLGRITSGVWIKLAEVIMGGRSAGVAGEITDSPAALMTILLMLVHTFSMNAVASIDYWLNLLEKEIKDIVVSKHSAHLTEVERLLKEFCAYLEPFESIMQSLSKEQEDMMLNMEGDTSSDDDKPTVPLRVARFSMVKSSSSKSSLSEIVKKKERRRGSLMTGIMSEATIFSEALPEGIEKVPLSFAIVSKFFGKDPYREIHRHLDGNEQLDIKGLVYWKERLRKYSVKVESLKELITTQLDEKRNFMSFMLTIITTILAPLAVLTGYFGMNFENMKELDTGTYPSAPGVMIMWVISGFAYGGLLVLALHFRVLYSAT